MPNEKHGKEANIVNEMIKNAADSMGMSFEDSMKNMKELIEIELNEHKAGPVHGHGLDHRHDHKH